MFFRALHNTHHTISQNNPTTVWPKIGLYVVSVFHAIGVTIMFVDYFLCATELEYTIPFDTWISRAAGFSAGYYISDLFEMMHEQSMIFVIHHIVTLFHIWINWQYNLGGLYLYGMAIAELSAVIFNIRYIFFKLGVYSKRDNLISSILYFILRTVVGVASIIDCFVSFGIPWQPMVIPILITVVSTKWGVSMVVQSMKLMRSDEPEQVATPTVSPCIC
jgi:hypothetical protein